MWGLDLLRLKQFQDKADTDLAAFKLAQRQTAALERIATALESINEKTTSIESGQPWNTALFSKPGPLEMDRIPKMFDERFKKPE